MLTRREFTTALFSTLVTSSLLETVFRADAFGSQVKPVTEHWLKEVNDLGHELRGQKIAPHLWQQQMETLFNRVPLPDLLRFIDFEKLMKGVELPDLGVTTRDAKFPKLAGLPKETEFIGRVFAMSRGRAIIPHGHRNMVSGHLIIKGEMHVRHFERLHDEADYLHMRPTIDRHSGAGTATTISDEKDNIHWLIAKSETAYTFDVLLHRLNPKQPTVIENLDPDRAEKLKDEVLRVKKISVEEGLERYGKS
ncbi:MAG: hypothetical protein K1Y36_02035 [Blastocatellia bacterium]|nr:hypothetical protein [Blastocatellia bacterium]